MPICQRPTWTAQIGVGSEAPAWKAAEATRVALVLDFTTVTTGSSDLCSKPAPEVSESCFQTSHPDLPAKTCESCSTRHHARLFQLVYPPRAVQKRTSRSIFAMLTQTPLEVLSANSSIERRNSPWAALTKHRGAHKHGRHGSATPGDKGPRRSRRLPRRLGWRRWLPASPLGCLSSAR